MKKGSDLIAEERLRQINVEGFDVNRDKQFYENGQLIGAAGCYLSNALNKAYAATGYSFNPFSRFEVRKSYVSKHTGDNVPMPSFDDAWPWDDQYDKRYKHDILRSLIIAGALIAAEIDRVQCDPSTPPQINGHLATQMITYISVESAQLMDRCLSNPKLLIAAEGVAGSRFKNNMNQWLWEVLIRLEIEEMRLVNKKPSQFKAVYDAYIDRITKRLNN